MLCFPSDRDICEYPLQLSRMSHLTGNYAHILVYGLDLDIIHILCTGVSVTYML